MDGWISWKKLVHNCTKREVEGGKNLSHFSNSQGGWNKHGGGAKVPKLINVEFGINVDGGFFGKS